MLFVWAFWCIFAAIASAALIAGFILIYQSGPMAWAAAAISFVLVVGGFIALIQND